MSTRREWIQYLVGRVNDRKARVELLTKKGAQVLAELRAVIQSDVDSLNQELEEEIISVSALDESSHRPRFEIRHGDDSRKIEVILSPDDESLVCTLGRQSPMELKAKAFPKNGNIHFIEENQHVPSNERLSQILIEWLVKTVYQIY